MRLRDRLLPGLFLAAFPAIACAQQVTGIAGAAVGVGSISWTWNFVPTASSYTIISGRTGAVICTGPGQAGDPAGGVANVNVCVQTSLGTNTTQSILVGAIVAGVTQDPLKASPTFYTLTETPQFKSPGIDSVSEQGFVAYFSSASNQSYTRFFGSAVPAGGGTTLTQEVTNSPTQIGFGGAVPNTSYTVSVFSFTGGNGDFEGDDVNSPALIIGTTVTWANPPNNAQVVLNTPSSIGITWGANNNPGDTAYEVRYSSTGFATSTSIPIPFSAGFTGLSTTLTGLLTGETYTIHVTARNRNFRDTAPLVFPQTKTSNGGGAPGTIVQTIPAGVGTDITGTIGAGDSVNVRIAPFTFDQQVQMLIAPGAFIAACGGNAIDITVSPAVQPIFPVGLTFSLPVGAVNVSRLSIARYDPASNTCVPLPSTAGGNTVSARTNHFSSFVIQQVDPGGDLSHVRAFPNPFYVRKQALLTMDGLPAAARVRIYTLRGEEVFDGNANGSGVLGWAGTNKNGLQVSSGLYLAVVENGATSKVMKLAVIR